MQNNSHTQPSRPSTSENIAARIQSLRSILNSERHTSAEQQIALDALDREEADRRLAMERDAGSTSNHVIRPYNDAGRWEPQGGSSLASVARERRRGFRPSARLERQRDRMARLARSEPLEQVTSAAPRLSSLHTSRTRQASTDLELEHQPMREGRHCKRRKLDDGSYEAALKLPEYGLEGTLLPANLKMRVLDSGHPNDASSQVEEIAKLSLHLIDNKEVFRSRSNRCTILMKHQGDWPFNLSKLVIKLPRHDYDAAPLQGMVFVLRNSDALSETVSSYDSLIPAMHAFHRPRRYDSYRPPPDYVHRPRSPYHPPSRPRRSSDPHDAQWCDRQTTNEVTEVYSVPGFDVNVEPLPNNNANDATSIHSPRPWHDADQEYSRRQYALRADSYRASYIAEDRLRYTADERARRLRAAALAGDDGTLRSVSSSGSEDEDTPLYRGIPNSQREFEEAEDRQRHMLEQLRARREGNEYSQYYTTTYPLEDPPYEGDGRSAAEEQDPHSPNDVSSLAATGAQSNGYASTKRLPGYNDMLQGRSINSDAQDHSREVVPHAKFQVTREGGGVSVNFDPHVSGKYILVKLWSQCPNSSVTLQSIAPFGFAGLRQVPDMSFR